MMTLIRGPALSTALFTSGLAIAQPLSEMSSPATVVSGGFPHVPTAAASLSGLVEQGMFAEGHVQDGHAYVQPEDVRTWIERFGHIVSFRVLARLAWAMWRRPECPPNGDKNPVGGVLGTVQSKKNTFGRRSR